jgi:integrase
MHELYLSEVENQINQYFSYQPTTALAPSSLKSYNLVLFGKLYPFCQLKGINRLDDSFVKHMDSFVEYLKKQGCKGQTIQSYLTITKLLFTHHGYALDYSYRIPRVDKQARDLKREKRWFTRRDIAMCITYIFDKNHNRNHALVRIMCETGARLNEIASIKYEDIFINENKLLFGVSKTVPRTVKVSPETSIYLDRFISQDYSGSPVGKRVFPGKNQIYKLIIDMLKDLGLKNEKDGRGPHTFRHWLATHLYFEVGADINDIAYLLGDQRDTIQDHYLHPTPDMMANRLKRAAGF